MGGVFERRGPAVEVPDELKDMFASGEARVAEYFEQFSADPSQGTIRVGDERYILVRASALSHEFLNTVRRMYFDRGDAEALTIGRNFLFDIAHVLGMTDARSFHTRLGLRTPLEKASVGPPHFAYTGWAFVQVLEGTPSPDEDFYFKYNHPFSFEADAWLRSGLETESPVCIMSTGYSSGWCEASYDIPLTAVEIACKACGDPTCTFVMAPPRRIVEYLPRSGHVEAERETAYEIPTFFQRREVEERLRQREAEARERSEELERTLQELREAQAFLVRHEKLAALGQLAGGIAHDLRNPLAGIRNAWSIIADKLDVKGVAAADPRLGEIAEALEQQIDHCVRAVGDLLEWARGKAPSRTATPLPKLIEDAVGVVAAAPTVRIEREIPAALPVPYLDPDQFRQVVTNLVQNAVDVVDPETGCVTVRAGGENGAFRLEVLDDGPGMAPEVRAKAFEPLFTTKPAGTGLGLAIARGVVQRHGGTIEVESEPGQGTRVLIRVPVAGPSGERASGEGPAAPPSGGAGD